ncbi:hypothetical protein GGR57DRAFT_453992 [Xylariaceae sp. FL1272]|nr:hypothetical protein GGR57DRAFT_453992 [Xylariaceae sp. FL1272]
MPRSKPDDDFKIYVDASCLSTPMDEETQFQTSEVGNTAAPEETPTDANEAPDTSSHVSPEEDLSATIDQTEQLNDDDAAIDPVDTDAASEHEPESSIIEEQEGDVSMASLPEPALEESELQPSIESDEADAEQAQKDRSTTSSRASSRRASKRTEELIQQAARDIVAQIEHDKPTEESDAQHNDGDDSQLDQSMVSDSTPRADDGAESSSQHEDDVFSDKSYRSSLGSYDGGSESGKKVDSDNMTTITRSPRISDISQYDKEDFVPTARGTPRPPFRTPSDVRAMQMSSPPASVLGSPRSTRKHFPTVSRLGTPSASAQYSPKRRPTPERFKSRQEPPLVLLHVTLLPLRWMWGDLVNNLDPADMSEQTKTLRDSWRILQDRVGDTTIERGILLGHPQNDYEVLEERLLEALDLPVRRRARILECGHYLGPSNENTIAEEDEDSDDGYDQERRKSGPKRHWCATCKNEIRYDALGDTKVFRVKVYASNGLMRAGAWEACWKEMERVDVEIEPIVEPSNQDEIVRLAAVQQEREMAQQEEAEIAKQVALQFEEHRQSEERLLLQAEAEIAASSPLPLPEIAASPIPEPTPEPAGESRASRRRHEDEDRLREIYGHTPVPQESMSNSRQPSSQHHPDSYIPPPTPRSPSEEAHERRETRRRSHESDSLPELLLQSVRVLMRDSKNIAILTLSVVVLIFAMRKSPADNEYRIQPIMPVAKSAPEMHIQAPQVVQQETTQSRLTEQIVTTPSSEPQPSVAYQEPAPVVSMASQAPPPPAEESQSTSTSVSTVYEPCETPTSSSVSVEVSVEVQPQETEIVTEKKVVKIVQTVTETQTECETATAVETIKVKATETAQPEAVQPEMDEMLADGVEVEAETEPTEQVEVSAIDTPEVEIPHDGEFEPEVADTEAADIDVEEASA